MPENEKCWACVQVVNHYPESVPTSALADVQGQDIPLCDRHWSWWVAHWMSPETGEPGVSAHVINLHDPLPDRELCDAVYAIYSSTEDISREVNRGRQLAHQKHGENSIEAIDARDLRWLSILVEEVGEAAHELTYDATGDLRAELIDILTVATAWVAAIDRAADRANGSNGA